MAWVGIRGKRCPECGSFVTDELQVPSEGGERKVYLKCMNCGSENYYGTYRLQGSALVKVR